MKKFLLFAAILLATMPLVAGNVNYDQAQTTVVRFVQSSVAGTRFAGVPVSNVKLLHAEQSSVLSNQPVYYIFNTDKGFVIVSGDDRTQPILAFGDSPLNLKSMPDNMKFWLGTYKAQIEYLQSHPGLVVNKPQFGKSLKSEIVEPMLTAMWDQSSPYYNQCPTYNGSRCLTGCPATSLAMVFYYWKYPTDPTPEVEGYTNNSYGFEIPALPSITFDWDNMLDTYTYGNYSTDQANAVAWLMRYIGQEEHMDYTPNGSGAYGDDILRAVKFFDYDEEARLEFKSRTDDYANDTAVYYTDEEWALMLQNEMYEGRPVVYCAYDYSSWYGWSGHAFNVDGYNPNTNTYHVNWGWSGSGNGDFALNAFNGGGSTYNIEQQMIMGIQPPAQGPSIKANRSKLNIEAFVEQSNTATFTVKGKELTSAITVTLDDESGAFSIDANSVAVSDQENGKVITVTYAPQSVGNHTATITLSNPDAESKTVTLNGVATLETYPPVMLSADESYINLTKFRADWTDQTDAKYVDSYTLEVNTKPSCELLDEVDWSNRTEEWTNYYDNPYVLIPQGWTYSGSSLWSEDASISFGSNTSLTTPTYDLSGYEKLTVVFVVEAYSSWSTSSFTVSTSLASQAYNITDDNNFQQYVLVLDCAESDNVTFTTTNSYPKIQSIKVYAGELDDVQLRAVGEDGDANYRLITGITNKFYTIKDLAEAGTFYYRVKAFYTDGTSSSWSKSQTVTLFQNGHGYELGDVNHDEVINVSDVTLLIAMVLSNEITDCGICGDMNVDGILNVADVTALITKVLNQ